VVTGSPAATPAEGDLLWTPSPARIARANLTRFTAWLRDERGHDFVNYDELWRWSVADLDGFWQCIWDYFGIRASSPPRCVLENRTMPGAQWFPDARLNYAEHALCHERPGAPAVMFISERESLRVIGWEELGGQVRVLAERLRALGVRPGDRVVASCCDSRRSCGPRTRRSTRSSTRCRNARRSCRACIASTA
jgi:acetoacetyl-CoA synthetase